MTGQTRNALFAFALAVPPTIVALAVWLPDSYWL